MHRHLDLLQGVQELLQPIGEGDGRGGIGEHKGASQKHGDSQHHKQGVENTLPGDGEDPEGHQGRPLGIEEVEQAGEQNDKEQRLHALQNHLELDFRERHHRGQRGKDQGVGHHALGAEERHDIDDDQDELGAGIQPVDNGISREKLPQGDVLKHGASLPSASSGIQAPAPRCKPRYPRPRPCLAGAKTPG